MMGWSFSGSNMARMKRCCSLLPWHSAGSDSNDEKPYRSEVVKRHKHFSLTVWFSVFCLVYSLALIAALEYCFGTFPSADSRRAIPDGRGYEIYGPFNSAPLGRMAAVTTASTAIPTASSLRSWNTSTTWPPVTSRAVLTSTSTPTRTSSIASSTTRIETPYNWDDAYNQVVMFGITPGIPGYGLNITIPDIALSPNQTTPATNSSLVRRVPPRDKWGQISGRVQYVIFDVLSNKYRDEDPWTVSSYVWYFYLSRLTGQPSDKVWLDLKDDESACPIVCDGPALVFLKSYCWDSWKDKARLYSVRLRMYPGATTTQSEDVWRDATVCASVTREPTGPGADIVASSFRSKWTGNVGLPVTIRTTVDGTPTEVVVITPAPTALPVVGTARPSIGGGGGDGGVNGGHVDGGQGGASSVTEIWITTTLIREDSQGRPVSTITAVLRATHTTMTLYDSSGRPTATITTDLLLAPGIRTVDEAGDGRDVPALTTTITTGMVALTHGGMMIVTDSGGIPVATVRGYRADDGHPAVTVKPDTDSSDRTGRFGGSDGDWSGVNGGESGGSAEAVHPLSWGDYVVASFAPVLMALPLAILIQIHSSTIKQLLPFHVLSRADGAGVSAGKSLCLTTGGIQGLVNSIQLLIGERDPLLLLADLHVLASSLVVSFSSEAMGVKLYGQCTPEDFTGCRMGMAVFRVPGRMAEAFLVLTMVINLVTNGLLRRRSAWKRAVDIYSSHGGSVSSATSLLTNGPLETQTYIRKVAKGLPHGAVSDNVLKKNFAGCSFSIRSSSSLPPATAQPEKQQDSDLLGKQSYYLAVIPSPPNLASMFEEESGASGRRWQDRLVGIFTTRYQDTINQVGFLLAIVGFLIMLFYYELTSTTSAFERFMNSQGLGVRAVFTGLGMIVSLFWDNYFSNVATQRPYRQLQSRNTPSSSSTSFSSAGTLNQHWRRIFPCRAFSVLSKPFVPLTRAIKKYTFFFTLVTLTTALSKITPLLLSNVPFSPWLTWTTHEICTWTAVGILLLMVVVLLCGMAIDGLHRRRERRGREQGHVEEFVEVDLSTLGGKLVFGSLYPTDGGGNTPPPLSTASSWETLRVGGNKF